MTSALPSARTEILARVDQRAHEVSPGQALRKLLAGIGIAITTVLFCLGWVSAKILRGSWLALMWVYAALAEGFVAGIHGQRSRPD